jgi:hypothetical protein
MQHDKKLDIFCLFNEILWEDEVEIGILVYLVETISKQERIQAIALLFL